MTQVPGAGMSFGSGPFCSPVCHDEVVTLKERWRGIDEKLTAILENQKESFLRLRMLEDYRNRQMGAIALVSALMGVLGAGVWKIAAWFLASRVHP